MEFGPSVVCHVIFPSKAVLTEHFYGSDLVRQDLPIDSKRAQVADRTRLGQFLEI